MSVCDLLDVHGSRFVGFVVFQNEISAPTGQVIEFNVTLVVFVAVAHESIAKFTTSTVTVLGI